MLISLSKEFIFLANLKSASTAIEAALSPYAQVVLTDTRFGKHQLFSEVETRFQWMLNIIDPQRLLVFGVLRDPAELLISLYNSHRDP
jgi:hypothetical protein